ncbi:hypothetical protein BVY03_05855 [bacterium K02(2017)]|nr:hypothetical protein BVY03_05855 [bacterium K02(2017)]
MATEKLTFKGYREARHQAIINAIKNEKIEFSKSKLSSDFNLSKSVIPIYIKCQKMNLDVCFIDEIIHAFALKYNGAMSDKIIYSDKKYANEIRNLNEIISIKNNVEKQWKKDSRIPSPKLNYDINREIADTLDLMEAKLEESNRRLPFKLIMPDNDSLKAHFEAIYGSSIYFDTQTVFANPHRCLLGRKKSFEANKFLLVIYSPYEKGLANESIIRNQLILILSKYIDAQYDESTYGRDTLIYELLKLVKLNETGRSERSDKNKTKRPATNKKTYIDSGKKLKDLRRIIYNEHPFLKTLIPYALSAAIKSYKSDNGDDC